MRELDGLLSTVQNKYTNLKKDDRIISVSRNDRHWYLYTKK